MPDSSTDLPIERLKGVGPGKGRLFKTLGITTIREALHYLPCRYEDRSTIAPISSLVIGISGTASGTVVAVNSVGRRRGGVSIVEIVLHDGEGYLKVKWFNQPYMLRNFRVGQAIVVSGVVKRNAYSIPQIEMDSPEYEIVTCDEEARVHTGRVVPVYRLTEGISQKQFRKLMFAVVEEYASALQDPLPAEIISACHLPSLRESICELHFPRDVRHIHELNSGSSRFHSRLVFDELFLFELGLAVMKRRSAGGDGISIQSQGRLSDALLTLLPFDLTSAQKRVIDEIRKDMKAPRVMNRLIQGDVGCGKTVVALAAMLDAVESGYQAALMAPTEILAEQHYLIIYRLIEKLGLKVLLLTGGARKGTSERAEGHDADIVVGTHALIQETVKFRNLGLVVIDEQHKFGVMQRALLRKKGKNPDLLVMTATPIPRSLALTLYGDLDSSLIDELPPGRQPVETRWVSAIQREEIFNLLKKELAAGRQAYVVYPAIEGSEKADLKTAIQGKEAFEQKFPAFRVGLLHGRMKTGEKDEIMHSFKAGEIDILVSTTVIEVGVDVPDATLMIIVHAERFGLSQLHQLRGRVGRSAHQSFCILIAYPPLSEDARRRLDIMVKTNDGFRVAEKDLEIRGPGEFLGTRQAGLPDLRHADIVRDGELLEKAKQQAFRIIGTDPELEKFPFLKRHLDVFWKGRVDFFRTG